MFCKFDMTFFHLMIKELPDLSIQVDHDQYIIVNPKTGKFITLDIRSALHRPHEDHRDMMNFIKWTVLESDNLKASYGISKKNKVIGQIHIFETHRAGKTYNITF